MLGKHFALLGSTGTGKSTAAALILHRICTLAPQGHVVMIDPHGEYGAAFGEAGALFDVSNIQMPYWLMNLEEHCEVFVTSAGATRQVDADILAKCLLAAKAKSRAGQEVAAVRADRQQATAELIGNFIDPVRCFRCVLAHEDRTGRAIRRVDRVVFVRQQEQPFAGLRIAKAHAARKGAGTVGDDATDAARGEFIVR